jgi:hypothetical protein
VCISVEGFRANTSLQVLNLLHCCALDDHRGVLILAENLGQQKRGPCRPDLSMTALHAVARALVDNATVALSSLTELDLGYNSSILMKERPFTDLETQTTETRKMSPSLCALVTF